jgi:hypothetical protein
MRNQTDSEENLAPGIVPKTPWRLIRVQELPGFRLLVEFVDGTVGEVDLSRLVALLHEDLSEQAVSLVEVL